MAVIVGTDGKDTITDTKVSTGVSGPTTNDADTVTALFGNDLVGAAGGNDLVWGDLDSALQPSDSSPAPVGGNDRLYGDDGNDGISGDATDILGGAHGGNDRIYGGAGNDGLNGDAQTRHCGGHDRRCGQHRRE